MVKQKYVKRRKRKKIPWYVLATERALKRKLPQQWEQLDKKVEAEEWDPQEDEPEKTSL